jgi:5'-nucleotidase
MNILLTNDDGISAQGINALYEVLSKKHNVFIIAPEEERSGSSNAITFKDHIKARMIDENKFAVEGYPADCVNLGLKGNIIPKADLVISGINHGPNIGEDIHFSGTVGGARVAYIYGISGIAISINCKGKSHYFSDAADFLLKYIEESELLAKDNCMFLNINYPDLSPNKILGIKYTSLGKRNYSDFYEVTGRENERINLRYKSGTGVSENDGSDISEVMKGYITITPLLLDSTDYELLYKINNDSEFVDIA